MIADNKYPYGWEPDGPDKSFFTFAVILSLIAIGILIVTFAACRTTKTSEQKQYEATQKELITLQALRTKYPCDTSSRIVNVTDTAIIFTADTSYVPRLQAGQVDTVYITRYKTITHNVDHIIKVIDMAALQASRDSAVQSMYLFNQCAEGVAPIDRENTKLKQQVASLGKWRTGVLIGIVIATIAGLCTVVFAIKKIVP